MPLMTGSDVAEKVGDRCGWVADTEPSNFPFTYCGLPSAYVATSLVNGSLFYACVAHMASERTCKSNVIAQIQTYSSAGACDF